MRKFGALSLAAFYLLLTTGTFVCLLHCTGAYFLSNPKFSSQVHIEHEPDHDDGHDAHVAGNSHHHKKPCRDGKDCNCCDKHGNYVIKENLNYAFASQLTAPHLAALPLSYQQFSILPSVSETLITWPRTTGPPGASKSPLYIYNRSLLI